MASITKNYNTGRTSNLDTYKSNELTSIYALFNIFYNFFAIYNPYIYFIIKMEAQTLYRLTSAGNVCEYLIFSLIKIFIISKIHNGRTMSKVMF